MKSLHWYFTFGPDHLNGNGRGKYVEVWGDVTYDQARNIMWSIFDDKWAFQYNEDEFLNSRTKLKRHMIIEVKEG